uniref:Uncharacterized protein n=1 Tax=Salmo trutta TaxID=8032 RepID=A0A674BX79_SALTR
MPATTRLISRLTQFASEGATVVVSVISEESDHIAAAVDVSSRECVEKLLTIQVINSCADTQTNSVCVAEGCETNPSIFPPISQATFLLTQAVGKALVASGAPKCSVITVGKVGNIEQANYSASKAVVEGTPWLWFITTPMTDKVPEKLTSMVPLERMGEPAGRNTIYTTLYAIDHITNAELGGKFTGDGE